MAASIFNDVCNGIPTPDTRELDGKSFEKENKILSIRLPHASPPAPEVERSYSTFGMTSKTNMGTDIP